MPPTGVAANWMRTQLYMLSWYGRYPTDSTSGPSR
jgi:hypothetical protein